MYTDAILFQNDFDLTRSSKNNAEIKILKEPADAIGKINSYVNFSALVEANNPTFQWYNQKGEQIRGKSRSNLPIGPVKEEDFGFYRLEIMDGVTKEAKLSRWVELKKSVPKNIQNQHYRQETPKPKLVGQTEGRSYVLGSTIIIGAQFENATTYQWFKDGMKLDGCTGTQLQITNATWENRGNFTLVAANTNGDQIEAIIPVHITDYMY